jgi:hypothetical protein
MVLETMFMAVDTSELAAILLGSKMNLPAIVVVFRSGITQEIVYPDSESISADYERIFYAMQVFHEFNNPESFLEDVDRKCKPRPKQGDGVVSQWQSNLRQVD